VKPAQRLICGGIFTPDLTVPADPLTGELTCRCQLTGKPGDAHHTVPVVDVDVQQRAAGERREE
jgi:hypothetical protein